MTHATNIMEKLAERGDNYSYGIETHHSEGYRAWINYLPERGGNWSAFGATQLAAAQRLEEIINEYEGHSN